MPLPRKNKKESPDKFMSRCMSDDKMKSEYPDQEQRTAICISKACENSSYIDASNLILKYQSKGRFTYKDPKTGEYYYYQRQGIYRKNGRVLVYVSKSSKEDKQKP